MQENGIEIGRLKKEKSKVALRIRKDRKTIVCAAKSEPEEGDCYINDCIHYVLAVEMDILHSNKDKEDTWYFEIDKKKIR